MRNNAISLILKLLAIILLNASPSLARNLSFEERVLCQGAIERVYYSRQIGVTIPFEESVPQLVLEEKIRTYLKKSVALEQYWQTPVTAEMLQREMIRIAENTRFPDRLEEIYTALGNDSFLMQECLARPALVDRLARSFFSSDERIHAATRAEAESLRTQLADGEVSPLADAPNRTVVPAGWDVAAPDLAAADVPGTGGEGSVADVPDGAGASRALFGVAGRGARRPGFGAQRSEAATVTDAQDAFIVKAPLPEDDGGARLAIYSFPKVPWDSWWGIHQNSFNESGSAPVTGDSAPATAALASLGAGHLDCIAGDTWNDGSINPGIPDARSGHVAVWTGSVMVIWGGSVESDLPNPATNTGGRYDPLTDRWMPMSTEGAPQASAEATAVWTGYEMIVWGGKGGPQGRTLLGTGGRYDPVRDVWAPVSTLGAPSPRNGHTAVWTGNRMIVWGGLEAANRVTFTGGRYDPATGTWSPTSTSFVPEERAFHQALWTGAVMVVWGGFSQNHGFWPNRGGRYNSVTDTWQPTTALFAPGGRERFSAVWTGSEMLVQGGLGPCVPPGPGFCVQPHLKTGGRYDPVLDQWRPMSTLDAPFGDHRQAAVWTGREMVAWGSFNYGARYDPVADHWLPISTVNAPSVPSLSTAVWTGDLMIVWGGSSLPKGGRYDPASDTWTPTSMLPFIAPWVRSSAVWTGSEMIFWGGNSAVSRFSATNQGSRYDPLLDQWSPTSTVNVPLAREHHLAVWTGNSMVIWGGDLHLNINYSLDTGGRYDPRSDSWSATSTTGAPVARSDSTAVWTGSSMIIWGGALYGGSYTNTGGRYDPVADRWTPVSTLDAPAARFGHTAVWSGTEMVAWGGTSGSELNSGGRYDPVLDRWSPTALLNAPMARQAHSSVWTGTEMLIWGGVAGSQGMSSGALYNPVLDSWQAMSQTGTPSARTGQTAFWTGKEMIVWGGQVNNQPLNTGGRYDPSLDQWMATSVHGAPEGRWHHTAVWTGEMMIIWGGPYSRLMATGGRYFPDPAGQMVAADAGDALTAECSDQNGTPVTLSGTGSSCDSSAVLAYSWSGPFPEGDGSVQGAVPMVTLPLGTSTLTLQVDDGLGHNATDTVTVTVQDTTLPALTCPSVAPAECSSAVGTPLAIPPAQVSDVCDPHPAVVNSHGPGGAEPSGTYPLGQTDVAMTATDASGNQSACSFPVTVHDTTPPQISSSVTPAVLWPPNHRMVDVGASVVATDACGASSVTLASVTSNEPDDAPGGGDGNTTDDIQGAQIGTANFDLLLRAERDGSREGRAYQVTYIATDSSGNQASTSSIVFVPHDQGAGAEPLLVSTEDSTAGTLLRWDPVPSAFSYKVIRGTVSSLREAGDFINLGMVACIQPASMATSTQGQEDAEIPPVGEAFFYLVAYNDGRDIGYGSATATKPRVTTGGGCE